MKLITAVVRPDKLDEVMRAATATGARGLTAIEVWGFGQQYGHLGGAAQAAAGAVVLPKLRVETVVRDEVAEPVTEAIASAVRTGVIGDGKIWVCPVDSALRVRTGERDRDAV
jgi:nitrogen regulatory protein PII